MKNTSITRASRVNLETTVYRYGQLSSIVPGFVPRPVQLELAQVISNAIMAGDNALLEAGTGTGKTFAYLLPLFSSGKKAIISTGTKALQDQLFIKDLPLVASLFKGSYKVALLKGRANYVCPERLDKSLKVVSGNGAKQFSNKSLNKLLDKLVSVREWSSRTQTGDLTELSDFHSDPALISMITSTRDNCLGSRCPRFDECPLYRARDRANEAELVVVNHHLLFADLALKEDNLAHLLPTVDVVVVDEAHQVPDVARQFFGNRIGSGQVIELARDIRQELALLGNDEPQLVTAVKDLETAIANMTAAAKKEGELTDLTNWLEFSGADSVEDVDLALGEVLQFLQIAAERSRGLDHCRQRTIRIIDQFALLTEPNALDENYVHWMQLSERGFVVHLSPVSISNELARHFNNDSPGWIFTSATLAVGNRFDHIRGSLGLDERVIEKQFDSPFNYSEHVLGYIPEGLPLPGTDEHTRKLLEVIRPFLEEKSLILFTSHRALKLSSEVLLAIDDSLILYQGQLPKVELLERFRSASKCILLATQSFWEGIDLRGAGMRCLVIDKLPFASPEDPISRAMMKSITSAGGNGFMEYLLPQAIISLKQGFGRLIRQETDRGLFILGDPRVNSKSYGKLVLGSLPKIRWTSDERDALEHLAQICMEE